MLSIRSFFVGLAALSLGALCGCSSSPTTPVSNPSCDELTVCCATMTGAAASACLSIATSGNTSGSAACATELVVLTQSGSCGGATVTPDAGFRFDATLACALTGTCPDAGKPSPPPDAGGGAKDAGGGSKDTGAGGSDAGGGSKDAGVDVVCGTAPALHPESEAGVYCPFTPTGAVHCTPGQECCESPASMSDQSSCETIGTTCPISGSLDWQCNGPDDCATNELAQTCCAAGTVAEVASCGFRFGSGFTGSHCESACGAGEVVICDKSTYPCASGTCTPFKISGVALGTCL